MTQWGGCRRSLMIFYHFLNVTSSIAFNRTWTHWKNVELISQFDRNPTLKVPNLYQYTQNPQTIKSIDFLDISQGIPNLPVYPDICFLLTYWSSASSHFTLTYLPKVKDTLLRLTIWWTLYVFANCSKVQCNLCMNCNWSLCWCSCAVQFKAYVRFS